MELHDKVVIITGASKGLGVAMAHVCAAEGAKVVLAARSADLLEQVAGDVRARGGTADAVATDVSRLDELQRLVDAAVARHGRIDGLINNAGVNYVKPFLETRAEDFDHVVGIDLRGSFFLSQLVARQMLAQQPRGGSIVQIASVHSHASVAGAAPYDAAKHGMVGFTQAAALELARDGIRLNVLSPGLCRTEIWDGLIAAAPDPAACLAYWMSNVPAERLIEPEEVAQACVFLLSDRSSAVTGANLMVDLGMTANLISREPYASQAIDGR